MGNIGFTELIIILIIILIIFGPGKLPEIGEALGKAVGNFKRAVKKGENEPDEDEKKLQTSSNEKTKKTPEDEVKG